jgi:hypothetical protein
MLNDMLCKPRAISILLVRAAIGRGRERVEGHGIGKGLPLGETFCRYEHAGDGRPFTPKVVKISRADA